MNQPTISVIIPVYNGEKYLREAIDSVLRQTFLDIEILIIDDGSTDASATIINNTHDDRIVRIFHAKNKGLCATLNEGVLVARGEFIARLDQDDIAESKRFEDALRAFNETPQSIAIFGGVERIGPDGMSFGSYTIQKQKPIEPWSFARHGMIVHGAALFRKEVLMKENEIFRQDMWPCDDLDLNLRLSRRGLLTVINKPALKYRIHPNAETFVSFLRMRFITRYLLKIDALEKSLHKPTAMTQDEYKKTFERGIFRKAINLTNDYGQLFFRRAGLSFASHTHIKGYFYLTLGMLLNPKFAFDRLSRLTKNI